jgi:CheY-like chemotaxis protein
MQPLASSSAGLRILVADDYPDTGESLQLLLKLWGHEVLVTHSGRQALAAVEEFRPHMVLLDFQMPGLNGGEVAQRMRQLPGFERLVIVAATGHDHDEESFQPYLRFFDHHICKPFRLGELENLLALRCSVEEPGSASSG